MSIRTDDPIPNSSSTVLLVEDMGLCRFLPAILSATSISDAKHDVHVVGGGGWTEVYRKYDNLVTSDVGAARIIPVLDADTLGQKGPDSSIHKNHNIFRFYFDFELEFSTSDCMLLDHALLLLLSSTFGKYGEIEALETWTNIVDQARIQTVQQNNNGTTLKNVEIAAKREINNRGGIAQGLRMPSKVELAEILAELCIATGALPPELAKLLLKVESKANNRPAYNVRQSRHQDRPLWVSPLASQLPLRAPALEGRILFSPEGGGLKFVDLSAGGTVKTIPGADDLGLGAWLPDGRIVATTAKSDGVVITTTENAQERFVLRQGIRESYLCWHENRKRVLLCDQGGQVFLVSEDNSKWSKISAPGYSHCLSLKEQLAWITRDYDTIYIRHLQKKNDSPLSIPGVIDGRNGLAWSHSGDELAFINANKNNSGRTICIWSQKTNETRFVMPWIGNPFHIAWSPDDKYLLFQLKSKGLFIVQSQPVAEGLITPLFRVSVEGGVLKCGAGTVNKVRRRESQSSGFVIHHKINA